MSETNSTEMASVETLDDVSELLTKELGYEDEEESTDEESTDEQDTEEEELLEEEEETLAGYLGIDDDKIVVDEEGKFAGVKVKIDGEVSEVKLPDLIAGYQTNKSNTQKAQAIAEQRKELDSLTIQASNEYTKKIETAEKLTEYLYSGFMKEFNGVNWEALRVQNPAEYAAMSRDFEVRKEQLGRIYSAINEEKTVEQQKFTQQQQQQQAEYIKSQAEKALANNPEWADPVKFSAEMDRMISFVGNSYGFSADEFKDVQDARVFELVKDAMRYRQGSQAATKKLAKPLPKILKSSGTAPKAKNKLEQKIHAAKTAKGYNAKEVKTDAIANLLFSEGI